MSANIVGYLVEKRSPKNPETFGHGVLFSLTILALIGPYLVGVGKRFLTKTK